MYIYRIKQRDMAVDIRIFDAHRPFPLPLGISEYILYI